jgi:hypothetical protein
MRITATERLHRLMMEVHPFRVGQRVRVSPSCQYAGDWREEYIITSIRWDYQRGAGNGVNISIASEDEIVHRDGDTDGFRPQDLEPVLLPSKCADTGGAEAAFQDPKVET